MGKKDDKSYKRVLAKDYVRTTSEINRISATLRRMNRMNKSTKNIKEIADKPHK